MVTWKVDKKIWAACEKQYKDIDKAYFFDITTSYDCFKAVDRQFSHERMKYPKREWYRRVEEGDLS